MEFELLYDRMDGFSISVFTGFYLLFLIPGLGIVIWSLWGLKGITFGRIFKLLIAFIYSLLVTVILSRDGNEAVWEVYSTLESLVGWYLIYLLPAFGMIVWSLWGLNGLSFERIPQFLFGLLFALFANLIFISGGNQMRVHKNNIQAKIDNGEYKVVEGVVEDFQAGHVLDKELGSSTFESFSINNVVFRYSYYDEDGYSDFAEKGGAIHRDGQYLRISYFEEEERNVIFKLEERIGEN